MISLKSSSTLTSAGILSSIAASLCCMTPVVALLAGCSSIAANLSWIEPARPYLIGISIAVLAFAWYIKLKPDKTRDMDCSCEPTNKVAFFKSKLFLAIATLFAILMMTFPVYAKIFTPQPKVQSTILESVKNKLEVKFTIHGMSCAGCELEVNNELSKIKGIITYRTSYSTKTSLVTFDKQRLI